MKSVVWVNILVQVAFPLAVTVSPVIASASELRSNPFGQETAVYTLEKGETVQSVADKFHVSLPALRKLNQLRTFAHGFDHLQAGDELDVPEPSVTGKSGDDVRADGMQDTTAQKVAGYASQAGGLLKNSHQGDAAASMARGMATGAAGGAIQQWLSHFGTARVQLNADEKFSLKDSRFDLLVPWFERSDMLMFSQGSLHRTDDRTQGNLGVGSRWFNDGWMVGANTFLDYDFSREHTRAGLGLEYWRDYLKLGANSYMRLSGWKDSPDVTDYQERPANGWDVRAQAWLPALPQLGGKLVFEQYYGDEVALFGKDNRQRNPHAITAGVNYTPFPLLTLGAEQRQGGSGKNDTRFDASLNFQPGVPWRQQLDPGAVGAMRSLMGSRYDLVDRNNNIVLEYRKKEVIHLHALGLVTGHPGEHKSLGVSVNSKYGLDRIDWDAGPLLAAGGLIQADSTGGYNAVLPQYHSGDTGINTYVITGVAVDKKGNRSEESHTQLNVETPLVDKAKSTFTPGSSVLAAGGESKQVLTLTVKDGQQQPVDTPVQNINIITTRGMGPAKAVRVEKGAEATVSAPVKKSTGVYEVTVTAGTRNETLTLTPEIFGETLTTAKVTISQKTPDPAHSSFGVSAGSLLAGNTSGSTLTFTAKDVHGVAIYGIADHLSFGVKTSAGVTPDADQVTVSRVTETRTPGVYTATLTGRTRVGRYTVVPKVDGRELSLTATVTLKAGDVDAGESTFAFPDGVSETLESGGAAKTLTFTAKDAQGDVISGLGNRLQFVPDRKKSVKIDPISEVNGVYTASVGAQALGRLVIEPEIDSKAVGALHVDVQVVPGTPVGGEGKSQFQVNVPELVADNITTATFTLTLKDAYGLLISDASTDVTVAPDNTDGVTWSGFKEDLPRHPGIYTGTLRGTRAQRVSLTPMYKGSAIKDVPAQSVTLKAGDVDAGESTFAFPDGVSETLESGGAAKTLTFTAKDAQGNVISGLDKRLMFVPGDQKHVDIGMMSEVNGVYTASVSGKVAGAVEIVPQIDGRAVGKLHADVTVTAGSVVNVGNSGFDVSPSAINADNTDVTVLKLNARDAAGNGMGNHAKEIRVEVKGADGHVAQNGDFTVSAFTETAAGSGDYTATLRGKKAGEWRVTPVFQETSLDGLSQNLTLKDVEPDGGHSSFVKSGDIIADGKEAATLTLTLEDSEGNPLPGMTEKLAPELKDASPAGVNLESTFTEVQGQPGVYTTTLTGTVAQDVTVLVQYNGSPLGNLSTTVTLKAGDADAGKSTFAFPDGGSETLESGGTAKTLTFTAKDAQGNVISGLDKRLTFVSDNPSVVTVSLPAETSTGSGIYTATVTGGAVGTGVSITPKIDNEPVGRLSVSVTVTAGTPAGNGKSTLSSNVQSITADGASKATLTLELKDAAGNRVTDVPGNDLAPALSPASGVEFDGFTQTSPGIYTGMLHGTVAQSVTITAMFKGAPLNGVTTVVTLTSHDVDGTKSSLKINGAASASVTAGGKRTVTFTAQDVSGNPVTTLTDSTLQLVADSPGKVDIGGFANDGGGVYTYDVTGKVAGLTTLHATVNSVTVGSLTVQMTVTPGLPVNDYSTFTRGDGDVPVVADDAAKATFVLTLRDAYGNPITGATADELDPDKGAALSSGYTWTPFEATSTPGVYRASVVATRAQVLTLSPRYQGSDIKGLNSVSVTFTAGAPDVKHSTLPGEITLHYNEHATMRWAIRDKFNNPVEIIGAVAPSVDDGQSKVAIESDGYINGVYSATVHAESGGTRVAVKPLLKEVPEEPADFDGGVTVKTVLRDDGTLKTGTWKEAYRDCRAQGKRLHGLVDAQKDAGLGYFIGVGKQTEVWTGDVNISPVYVLIDAEGRYIGAIYDSSPEPMQGVRGYYCMPVGHGH
ncbi:inverse autotransporter beta domain-containing protein [Enterobacter asburiae]|uniref:inverse autotransporter beta domain-containing protein n=1 Tax=Enterobacter asburiae TaxID=61645 RepID=UPI003F567BDE